MNLKELLNKLAELNLEADVGITVNDKPYYEFNVSWIDLFEGAADSKATTTSIWFDINSKDENECKTDGDKE